ncbi:hypothetical protein HDU81_010266 [Chytriomyces hyalinus]|nr:hypothetical protein HDU81_010266 [Chytriomyces hyalinus]
MESLNPFLEQARQLVRAHPLKSAASILALLVALGAMKTRRRSRGRTFNGPKGLPYIGIGLERARNGEAGKQHEWIDSLHRKYGDTVAFVLFGTSIVLSQDKRLVHKALTDTTLFWRSEFAMDLAKDILGKALFFLPTGAVWKHHRKILQPAFGPVVLKNSAVVVTEQTNLITELWKNEIRASEDGAIVLDMFHEFTAFTLDFIGRIAFSYDFEAVNRMHTKMRNEDQDIMEDMARILTVRFGLPNFLWWWRGVNQTSPRVQKVTCHVDTLLKKVVAERKLKKSAGPGVAHADLLEKLLGTDADGKPLFTETEILGEVKGFFFAGHETSANTLTFSVLELTRNPDIQEKLRKEATEVLSALGDDNITVDSLSRFKYLDQFVKEVQRRHSIVGQLGRRAVKDIDFDGYLIPEGTVVLADFRGLHMDPHHWKNPEKFDPDRWSQPYDPETFLPFGDGPTNCIGQKLALIEIKIALIHLVTKFRFEYVEQTLEFVTFLTYGLKKGLQVKITEL